MSSSRGVFGAVCRLCVGAGASLGTPTDHRAYGGVVTAVLLLTPDVVFGGWLVASGWRNRRRLLARRAEPERGVADEIEAWLALQ